MFDRYEPAQFEDKWRQRWLDADLFKTRESPGRESFYCLDFFPYPSGAGLSVGHCRNYVPTDVLSRMKAMQGYNVLHPMGFDAFGLPAENEAIKLKRHPDAMIEQYAANYQRQLNLVGISYDWSRSFRSSDPRYYRWTQWIFRLLYQRGLAYRSDAEVNWCPNDKTALANEEVVGGLCERCGTPVVKRNIPQWYFRITAYAQRLLDDLDGLDWPEGIKNQQRHWIGRSEGVQFTMNWIVPPIEAGDTKPIGVPSAELSDLAAEVAREAAAEPDAIALSHARAIKLQLDTAAADATEARDLEHATSEVNRLGEGFEVVSKSDARAFDVYTTRIDTVFGATFVVLAPEHPMVSQILKEVSTRRRDEVEAYCRGASASSDLARQATDRAKTGVFSGAFATNPATGGQIPIWIADYVLLGYGTGAIMAVPAHDQRDFEFATTYGLEIVQVIAPATSGGASPEGRAFEAKDGLLINSGSYTGQTVTEATRQLSNWFEECELGVRKVNYRLRDWLISRQRFWGCPIPVVYDAAGHAELVAEDALPVLLPDVESYEPGEDGASPLARIPEFVNATTSEGKLGRRETDTMGGFACSSWYFLRFCDPHNDSAAWDPDKVAARMPVDCYVGGAEHAVMHLLYARFWTKVLFDAGLVAVAEPFQRLVNQGQVLGRTAFRAPREGETLGMGEDGVLLSYAEAAQTPDDQITWKWVRMSKSKGNVVTPDEAVAEFGADALRLHELFVAPFDADVEWSNQGMVGTGRFLSRLFRLVADTHTSFDLGWRAALPSIDGHEDAWIRDLRRAVHSAIPKVTSDLERLAGNTAVATLMSLLNTMHDAAGGVGQSGERRIAWSEAVESFVLLLAPMAPHSADELWESLGRTGFTYSADWPTHDPKLVAIDRITVAIQVNGKLRDTIEVAASASQAELEVAALASEKAQAFIAGKEVRRMIVVAGKLVNVVVA